MTTTPTNQNCCNDQPASCECCNAPTLLFPCSGGSDVGALTDLAARQLTSSGFAKMYCLAGIGGRVSGILASTKAADQIVAIDGCPLNCAKATLEQAGFENVLHLNLTEIGLPKGQSPVTSERIMQIVSKVKILL